MKTLILWNIFFRITRTNDYKRSFMFRTFYIKWLKLYGCIGNGCIEKHHKNKLENQGKNLAEYMIEARLRDDYDLELPNCALYH